MWHCSTLFFLRHFPGLSESALWKDPLHLLLQPANYNTVIKRTQKQLPSYITVSDKHAAPSSGATLSSPLRKVESWVWLSLLWLLPEDSGNPECCLTCSSVENKHRALHRKGPKELQPHGIITTGGIQEAKKPPVLCLFHLPLETT